MSRCVVAVGVGSWYPRGVARLGASLDSVGDSAARHFRTDGWPAGSPPHRDLPYGFKFFAMDEARRGGADSVLWLDSSCWAVRSLDRVWQRLEETGHLLVDCANWLGQWSSDGALAALNRSRDESMTVPLVVGGMFGIRFSHPDGARFYDAVRALVTPAVLCGDWNNNASQCSADSRVRGHRHDQVALGHVADRMRLPLLHQPDLFAYATPHPDARTVIVAEGM